MWTPYTRAVANVAETIASIEGGDAYMMDWKVVERLEKQIDSLEEKKRALQRLSDRCEEQAKRTSVFKEELVANVFHPRNVERWLEQNIYDMMFGC